MELERIRRILTLPGGAAFAVSEGAVVCATAEAEALGLRPGVPVSELLPDLRLPGADEQAWEIPISLDGSPWQLRAAAEEDCTLCFLRPDPSPAPALNENTLLYASGTIRLALQDLSSALCSLAEGKDPERSVRAQSLALRSAFRLRQTAERMELFSRIRSGSYRPLCRELPVVAAASAFLGELSELLREAKFDLRRDLPARDFNLCLDWPLVSALLRELIANAAADSADGLIRVKLVRIGENGLRFSVQNRPTGSMTETRFGLYAEPQRELRTGIGLGLSLVSAGAAVHGGSLLLSTEQNGTVTALLSLTAGVEDAEAKSIFQLPTGAEADLLAFSSFLPPEVYRPELLL